MEQPAKTRKWIPCALGGVVVLVLGCGFLNLFVLGGAAGWFALTNLEGGAASSAQPTTANAPAKPTVSTSRVEASASPAAAETPRVAATDAPAEPPSSSSPSGMATHVHPGGWAVELGTQWRVELPESQGESNLYNYPADRPGSGAFEPGQTRIRIAEHGSAGTLDEFVATFPTEMQLFETQLPLRSEERWTLPGGLEAVRRDFGELQVLLFVVDGRGYEATGMGESSPFDEAMRTLRPVPAP